MTSHGTVTVGTARAEPGTTVRGAIPVTELAGGTPLEIPVVVINGAGDGPCSESGPTCWSCTASP